MCHIITGCCCCCEHVWKPVNISDINDELRVIDTPSPQKLTVARPLFYMINA